MAHVKIEHRDLFDALGSIKKQSQWLKAAESLGFRITSGGKHPYVVRDPENDDDRNFTSSVTTIPSHLHKVINQKIFRQFLDSPVSKRMEVSEDDIWRALGSLK